MPNTPPFSRVTTPAPVRTGLTQVKPGQWHPTAAHAVRPVPNVLKPAIIVAGARSVINVASWCQIEKLSPSVTQQLNTYGVLKAYSDTGSSYDGTTNAYKIIFNFEQAITTSTSACSQLILGYLSACNLSSTW